MNDFLAAAVSVAGGCFLGYWFAYQVVTNECHMLGAFYVLDKTYVCEVKK